MQELTKAEEQVMQYLWKLKKGFLKDIVDQFSEPKPAYTTISTVIRVLVKKDFIAFKTYGKVHEYYPLISKSEYFRKHLKRVISSHFNDSITSFASFFANDKDLNISELEQIKQIFEEQINKLKENDE